ncbi:MAG: hypothetical protein LBI69_03315 [Puniceicoccales bacterium]|jgi:hypothetical protein|nr:hypothetical protein [Puniceicoccales bacterium]
MVEVSVDSPRNRVEVQPEFDAKVLNQKTQDLLKDNSKWGLVRLLRGTNLGRITMVAFCTLGCTSGVLVAFTVFGLPSIPILWFILQFILNVGSFGSLVVTSVGLAILIRARKGKDIFTFPGGVQFGIQMYVRMWIAIDLMKRIDWTKLQLGKLGAQMVEITHEIQSALASNAADEKMYDNVVTNSAARLLHLPKASMSPIFAKIGRVVAAATKLNRQDSFNFEVSKHADEVLALMLMLIALLSGDEKNLTDEVRGMLKNVSTTGISNLIFRYTDGVRDNMVTSIEKSTQSIVDALNGQIVEERTRRTAFSFCYDSSIIGGENAVDRSFMQRVEALKQNIENASKMQPLIIYGLENVSALSHQFISSDQTTMYYKDRNYVLDNFDAGIRGEIETFINQFLEKHGNRQNLSQIRVRDLICAKANGWLNEESSLLNVPLNDFLNGITHGGDVQSLPVKTQGKCLKNFKRGPVEIVATLKADEQYTILNGNQEFQDKSEKLFAYQEIIPVYFNQNGVDSTKDQKANRFDLPLQFAADCEGHIFIRIMGNPPSPWSAIDDKNPMATISDLLMRIPSDSSNTLSIAELIEFLSQEKE